MQKRLIFTILVSLIATLFSCEKKIYKESFELTEADFQKYPIWENCIFNGLSKINNNQNITVNTFTPYLRNDLINPEYGFYYVYAKYRFADLSEYSGYLIPIGDNFDQEKIGKIEPTIFYQNHTLTFWNGILIVDSITLNEFYNKTNKTKSEIFPITFSVDSNLIGRKFEGEIHGIGHCIDYNCDSIKFEK